MEHKRKTRCTQRTQDMDPREFDTVEPGTDPWNLPRLQQERQGRPFVKQMAPWRQTTRGSPSQSKSFLEKGLERIPMNSFRPFRRRIRALHPFSTAADQEGEKPPHVGRKTGAVTHWHTWRNQQEVLVRVTKKPRSKRLRCPRRDDYLQQWSKLYVPLGKDDFLRTLARERGDAMPCTPSRLDCLALVLQEYLRREEQTTEQAVRKAFGDTPEVSKALRLLVSKGQLRRLGHGGRRDPFRYQPQEYVCPNDGSE